MQIKINALGVKLVQDTQQVLKAAAEAVDRPGGHDIKVPARDAFEQRIKTRPLLAAVGAGNSGILEVCTMSSLGAWRRPQARGAGFRPFARLW